MSLRIAVAQSPGGLDGVDVRLNWLRDRLSEVAGQGIELLLLPELFATGYNIEAAVRSRAEPRDGPISQRIGMLARDHGVAIHYGYPERAGDAVFNAAQCIGPEGQVLGHHRKLAIPPGPEQAYFRPGRGIDCFEWRGLTIATLICYDAEFAETARQAAAAGAELILVPTALGAQWGVVAQRVMPTRAFENGVYVAYANHAGAEGDLNYLGESVIVGPDGMDVVRAGSGEEVLVADIDPVRVAQAQARLPYLVDRHRLNLT